MNLVQPSLSLRTWQELSTVSNKKPDPSNWKIWTSNWSRNASLPVSSKQTWQFTSVLKSPDGEWQITYTYTHTIERFNNKYGGSQHNQKRSDINNPSQEVNCKLSNWHLFWTTKVIWTLENWNVGAGEQFSLTSDVGETTSYFANWSFTDTLATRPVFKNELNWGQSPQDCIAFFYTLSLVNWLPVNLPNRHRILYCFGSIYEPHTSIKLSDARRQLKSSFECFLILPVSEKKKTSLFDIFNNLSPCLTDIDQSHFKNTANVRFFEQFLAGLHERKIKHAKSLYLRIRSKPYLFLLSPSFMKKGSKKKTTA